ncbi:MAG: endonuclease domain-containing protein [Desulfobacterales bacterium]
MLNYNKNLKEKARQLRKNPTDSERRLWSRIRNQQILGVQFYRQKPIRNYIVDFYAPAANLVIEVDGSQHHENEHVKKDVARDKALWELGLMVLRFNSSEVLLQTDAVVLRIYAAVMEQLKGVDGGGNPP